jgi:hypothetical protein
MEIRNKDGVLVFDNANHSVNDYTTGWDGRFNGRVERGVYSFSIQAESLAGFVWTIKGNVCNCPCDQEIDKDLIPIKNCEFGLCDTMLNHCFNYEPLPCFAY